MASFKIDKYLGKWYEIARLDHSFERGLTNVTASYSSREDGGIRVINQGITKDGKLSQAEGKAYFTGKKSIGALKVSFFGPFYGGYNIVKLDKYYTMSLVIGPNLNYAWILARSPNPSKQNCLQYVNEAKRAGINTSNLIWIQKCI